MTAWKNLEKYDFEDILSKLPDSFQDTDVYEFLDFTGEMAVELKEDFSNVNITLEEAAKIMHAGAFIDILFKIGAIDNDLDHSWQGDKLEIWYKKVK